tara:strand:+ start:3157 stop:3936 length:780 start_codon:yes stop_codon:yes gene_type:complete
VIINYNNRVGLLRTIDSLKSDADGLESCRVEYIFVDGGSSDGSVCVIENQREYHSNVKACIGEDSGIYDAFNVGLKASSGEFVGFINSGDVLSEKSVIYEIISVIRQNKEICGIYGNGTICSKYSFLRRKRRPGDYATWKVMLGWMPPHPLFCIRKTAFERFGNFDTSLGIAADYDLFLRLFYVHRLPTKYIDRNFVDMEKVSTSGGSLLNIIKSNFEVLMSWKKHTSRLPVWIIFTKPISKLIEYRFNFTNRKIHKRL